MRTFRATVALFPPHASPQRPTFFPTASQVPVWNEASDELITGCSKLTLRKPGAAVVLANLDAKNACSQLEMLDVSGAFLEPTAVDFIATKMMALGSSRCAPLKDLWIAGNGLGDAGMRVLALGIASASRLTGIVLESNSIGDEGAVALGEALASPTSKLEELYLNQNPIGLKGALALAQGIEAAPRLKQLSVFHLLDPVAAITAAAAESAEALEAASPPLTPEEHAHFGGLYAKHRAAFEARAAGPEHQRACGVGPGGSGGFAPSSACLWPSCMLLASSGLLSEEAARVSSRAAESGAKALTATGPHAECEAVHGRVLGPGRAAAERFAAANGNGGGESNSGGGSTSGGGSGGGSGDDALERAFLAFLRVDPAAVLLRAKRRAEVSRVSAAKALRDAEAAARAAARKAAEAAEAEALASALADPRNVYSQWQSKPPAPSQQQPRQQEQTTRPSTSASLESSDPVTAAKLKDIRDALAAGLLSEAEAAAISSALRGSSAPEAATTSLRGAAGSLAGGGSGPAVGAGGGGGGSGGVGDGCAECVVEAKMKEFARAGATGLVTPEELQTVQARLRQKAVAGDDVSKLTVWDLI